MDNANYHKSVMLAECMAGLEVKKGGTYVDLTFGGGGHSREILSRGGKVVGFDQDADAEARGRELESEMGGMFRFVRGNFRFLVNYLKYAGIDKVDGVLADLGVSGHQFDEGERGFSFRDENAPVDMRMNREQEKSAQEILNEYDEEKLATLLYIYGELKQARKMAKAIVARRTGTDMQWTIGDLVETVKPMLDKGREKKDLAKVFQAIRIEVNGEMDALKEMLGQIPEVLKDEGRFVVMTYHSLEDRMVKNFVRTGNVEGREEKDFYGRTIAPMAAVNRKVIESSDSEVAENPRARSAKLRISKKVNNETE